MDGAGAGHQLELPRHRPAPPTPLEQDISAATLLSEVVYRAAELGQDRAQDALARLQGMLPRAAAVHLTRLQFSPAGQRQR